MRVNPVLSVLVSGALVWLALAGCGGGSTPNAVGAGSPAPTATAAPTSTAATSPTASTTPTRAEFMKRFRAEPDNQDLSSKTIDCWADVFMKYTSPDQLRRYIDGDLELDDVSPAANPDSGEPAARAAVQVCAAMEVEDLEANDPDN